MKNTESLKGYLLLSFVFNAGQVVLASAIRQDKKRSLRIERKEKAHYLQLT